jgi:hypothetical protein
MAQLSRRYTKSSTIVTSNKKVSEWAALLGDEILATAILDRLLHDAEVLTINGPPGAYADAQTSSTTRPAPTAKPSPSTSPHAAHAAAEAGFDLHSSAPINSPRTLDRPTIAAIVCCAAGSALAAAGPKIRRHSGEGAPHRCRSCWSDDTHR